MVGSFEDQLTSEYRNRIKFKFPASARGASRTNHPPSSFATTTTSALTLLLPTAFLRPARRRSRARAACAFRPRIYHPHRRACARRYCRRPVSAFRMAAHHHSSTAAGASGTRPAPLHYAQSESVKEKKDLASWWKNFKRSDKKAPEQGTLGASIPETEIASRLVTLAPRSAFVCCAVAWCIVLSSTRY